MNSSWWMFERQMMGALMGLFEPWIFAGFEAITFCKNFQPHFRPARWGNRRVNRDKTVGTQLAHMPTEHSKAHIFHILWLHLSLSLSLPLCSHFRHQDVATCHMMPNCGIRPQAAHSCECSSSQPACLAGKVREVSRCLWKLKLRWETTIASNNIQSFQPCSTANLIHNIHTIYLRYGNTPTEQSQS